MVVFGMCYDGADKVLEFLNHDYTGYTININQPTNRNLCCDFNVPNDVVHGIVSVLKLTHIDCICVDHNLL